MDISNSNIGAIPNELLRRGLAEWLNAMWDEDLVKGDTKVPRQKKPETTLLRYLICMVL